MRVRYYVPSGCGFMPWRSDNLAEALAEAKRRAVASGLRVNDLIAQSIADRLGKRSPPFRIMAPSKVPGSVDWGQRLINFASRRGDLLVHPRCRYVLDMLRHWNGVRTPGTDMGELAHAADCLRYGLTAALGRVEVYARLRLD